MMNRIYLLTALCCMTWIQSFGQDAEKYYYKAIDKAKEGKLTEAIELFGKSIELQPGEYIAWYNRGIAQSMLGNYEEALNDFKQTIVLKPDYAKGFLNRGIARKHLTDYDGALIDYTYAIQLNKEYGEAYYNRGMLYKLLSKKDSACVDFQASLAVGFKSAERQVEKCKDTTQTVKIYPILRLTQTAKNEQYGFTKEQPVKVGTGPEGGPSNQRMYLDLLRDAQGKPIQYERLGSCCHYETPNGFMGMGLLDQYQITYLNEKGKTKKAIVFISFYDYEEPQILSGFGTVKPK